MRYVIYHLTQGKLIGDSLCIFAISEELTGDLLSYMYRVTGKVCWLTCLSWHRFFFSGLSNRDYSSVQCPVLLEHFPEVKIGINASFFF